MRGRTKKHQMRFWSTFSPSPRILPILCTPCMMMARMVEFLLKYGHSGLLDREEFFRSFFWMTHTPPAHNGAFMSRTTGRSEGAWRQSVARVREYLNHVVQEIRLADRLNPFDLCPHFAFFMTHFTDSMPIASIGGVWSVDLWNPKYASHVFKVTIAVDMLGNIVWICPLPLGHALEAALIKSGMRIMLVISQLDIMASRHHRLGVLHGPR